MTTTNIIQLNVSRIQAPTPVTLQGTVLFFSVNATTWLTGFDVANNHTNYSEPHLITQVSDVPFRSRAGDSAPSIEEIYQKLTIYFANTNVPCYLIDIQPTASTVPLPNPLNYSDILTYLQANAVHKYYVIDLPDVMANAVPGANINNLLDAFSGLASQQYFTSKFAPSVAGATPGVYSLPTGLKLNKALIPFLTDAVYPISVPAGTKAAYASSHPDAAFLAMVANNSPSSINLAHPFAFRTMAGVNDVNFLQNGMFTPSNLLLMKNAGVNVGLTGTEGGLNNTILGYGTVYDGVPTDFAYWYSADWAQLQLKQALANEILNGANSSGNPLYYDQVGIQRLYARAKQVLDQAVTFGLIQSVYRLNAIPFNSYVATNPADYSAGIYNGLSATIVPLTGFKSITFALTISSIPLS